MKTEFMASVSRGFNRIGFQIKKHSPEILLGVGITGVVTSAVMACKATTKVNDILEQAKAQLDSVHAVIEADAVSKAPQYSEEDGKKAIAVVYLKTGLEFVKLYGPSVTLGVASIMSILASHNIMNKRNLALAAAYTAVDTSFKEYRGRVVERFGDALDRELKYGIITKEIEEVTVDENGEEKVEKKTVEVVDKKLVGHSEFARFFDETCMGWVRNAERNKKFLVDQQRYANDKLKAKGYLTLNSVYEMLGMQITQAGSLVGWVYDEKSETLSNYVDFGIFDIYSEENRAFVNGLEQSILLDFNVDGNIFELMNCAYLKLQR